MQRVQSMLYAYKSLINNNNLWKYVPILSLMSTEFSDIYGYQQFHDDFLQFKSY